MIFYGKGFLHNMVRIMVGTLLEVGYGRMKPEEIKNILEKKDRRFAGPTIAPEGLFLYDVEYQINEWIDFDKVYPLFL